MPTWVAGYFAVYLAVSAWSLSDVMRSGSWHLPVFVELVSDFCLLIPALLYWLPGPMAPTVSLSLPCFVLGVALFPLVVYRVHRKHFPDPNLSSRENVLLGIASFVLAFVVAAPLFWWGTESAVMERYAAP